MNTRKAPYPKVGMRFGILTIISKEEIKNKGAYFWMCRCDCGVKLVVWNHNLLNGNTKACRCVTRRKMLAATIKHGMRSTRQWNIWNDMKRRCADIRRDDYRRYGGKGIRVCNRWMSFEKFWEDMGGAYLAHCKRFGSIDTTLDRINNKKSYEIKNCRWATRIQQARSRSDTIRIKFKNEELPLTEWCERLNLNRNTVYGRLLNKWSIEDALTLPVGTWRKSNKS